MKKIYSFVMALCVVLCANASVYEFQKQLTLNFADFNEATIQSASQVATATPLQYDATATDGEVNRTFTSQDMIEVANNGGYFTIMATAADGSDCLALLLFANADANTLIPVGTYPINNTEEAGTVIASTGLTKQGQLTYSFYAPKFNGGNVSLPIYWLVGGEVVVTCTDGNLKVEVNGVNSNDVPVHVVFEYDLNAERGLQYDEKTGNVDRTYTAEDMLMVDTTYIAQYNLGVDIIAADQSDVLSLWFFVPAADPEIGLPAGTYPIASTPALNTALASEGVDAEGYLTPSYYATLTPYQGQLAPNKLWFLVSGQIVVEKVNGKMKLTVDAVNSYNVPVHVVYDPTSTAVENTVVENNNVQKLIKNNQLLIVKEGVEYNVLGSVVK